MPWIAKEREEVRELRKRWESPVTEKLLAFAGARREILRYYKARRRAGDSPFLAMARALDLAHV